MEVIIGVIIIAVIVVIVRRRKKKPIVEQPPRDPASQPSTFPDEVKPVNATAAVRRQMTMVDLGGYKSPSGGYENYGEFYITGYVLNEKTGRRNKFAKRITAKTHSDALEKAKAFNLIDTPCISVSHVEKPTEKQIEYASNLGVIVPDDAGKQDVSEIICRFVGRLGERCCDAPQPSPNEEFAEFADLMGLHFSKFIGADDLFSDVVEFLSGKDRAAFWAYSILCVHSGIDIGNMLKIPDMRQKLYSFAEMAVTDQAIMRSIDERSHYDYRHPHKGSNAYKAVAAFFGL